MATKQKILIVDDDNNIAELVALYLTKECFETKIVNDGEEALKQFHIFHPDLILLDLMLPGIDGYQVCREIRHTSDVPIIMLSAKGETFDKVLGLELGADDYIIKPSCKISVCRAKGKMCFLSGSGDQPDQLFCNLYGTPDRYAAKGAGASLFPGSFSQSGFHKRTASGSHLGL